MHVSIAILSTLIALAAAPTYPLRAAQNLFSDIVTAAIRSSAGTPSDQIVIVGLTENTFASLGRTSPVDRFFLAKLLAELQPAKVIGLDMFLGEVTDPGQDQALVDAINATQIPIVLGHLSGAESSEVVPAWQEAIWTIFQTRVASPSVTWGHVALRPGAVDGIVREYPCLGADGIAGFAVAVARAAGSIDKSVCTPVGVDTFRIAYLGNAWSVPFNVLPAEAIVDAPAPVKAALTAQIENKIVIVGTILAADDRYPTPTSRFDFTSNGLSGVVIHAHAAAQILRQDQKVIMNAGLAVAIIMVTAFLAAFCASLPRSQVTALVLIPVQLIPVLAANGILLLMRDLELPTVAQSVSLVTACGFVIFLSIHRAERLSKHDARMLSRMLGDNVMLAVRKNPEILGRGGQTRQVTVLFADLENSMDLVMVEDPGATVTLATEYLAELGDVVRENDGIIDKFTGDGVMAFFTELDESGASLATASQLQVERAVSTALGIRSRAEKFRVMAAAKGISVGRTRMGIHCGLGVVGNVGGVAHLDFTVMGEPPSIAARLEAANKSIGTSILVSDSVVRQCRDSMLFRPIGNVWLKGSPAPLSVFEPLPEEEKHLRDVTCKVRTVVKQRGPHWIDRVRVLLDDIETSDSYLATVNERMLTRSPEVLFDWDLRSGVR